MTNEELQALCLEWQNILRLKDWEIKCNLVRRGVFERPWKFGSSNFNKEHKAATIKVMIEDDKWDCDIWDYDVEFALVHELIHILFPMLDGDEQDEHSITMTASALVKLKRIKGSTR